ncbi:uncharacterized protein LOC120255145 [Dioscorea cayenensis subsp. rotundata]|uniref:Protein FAR1-RELATED SEQUENCE n=1 Tax=Dioscorea cayennensis subsp. rotundata TaxID=55577 RepID=A0AB40AVG1_DIOCR|nr:uncharacterized protein LOC120255145 [Dioscorea cayenensis subsp. rotundata]
MTSTQHSESINSFFDDFVNAQTPVDKFVMQYDKALFAQRNDEENEDFKTLDSISIAKYYTSHPIKKHVGEVYTRALFNIFQVELRESDIMLAKWVRDGFENAKYIICNQTVVFSKDCNEDGEPSATCSCKKFDREDMYEKIMAKLKDIFEILDEMSSTPEHRLCTGQNEENQEIIGSFSCLGFSSEDNVCRSNISILDPKPVKSKGRPRALSLDFRKQANIIKYQSIGNVAKEGDQNRLVFEHVAPEEFLKASTVKRLKTRLDLVATLTTAAVRGLKASTQALWMEESWSWRWRRTTENRLVRRTGVRENGEEGGKGGG